MVSRERRSSGRAAADPAIVDLLDTVREVRTTLAVDLSTAAGALDADHPEVARDILAAAAADLHVVATRTQKLGHDHAEPRRQRSRRTRALLALPAVPLIGAVAMTTAAALSSAHAKPATHHVVATSSTHTAASTTLQRLEHVVTHHPQAAQVIAVANDLHQQLTQMIATSNPAQLHAVRRLLTLEQHVLESSKVPGTQLALAASRAIAELLEQRPAHTHSKQTNSTHTTVRTSPTSHPTPSATSAHTHGQHSSQQHRSSSSTRTSPSSAPTNPLFGAGLFNGS
ncbi:MAG TPA: hypothetical protein VHE56_05005 [Mycobacteriales bacterium]|nr:hypothetical protein [Mycobacteriales bacterium]